MKTKYTPVKELRVIGLDERSLGNLLWCATSYRLDRLYWAKGYLFCIEMYDKSFDLEVERGILPVNQVCYTHFPKYEKYYEVEKGIQVPIVDVSEMRLYGGLVRMIRKMDRADCQSKKICNKVS
ncbi:MAG: hypothetical protein QXI32_05130 [Candidatus Bathyarchaeia archaeon]